MIKTSRWYLYLCITKQKTMKALSTLILILFTTVVLSQKKQVSDTIYNCVPETMLSELKLRKKYDVVIIEVNGEFHPMANPYSKKNKPSAWEWLIETSSPVPVLWRRPPVYHDGFVSTGFYSSTKVIIINK